MTTFDIGRRAEDAAAAYLQAHGFTVVERNWRLPACEIDIIAQKDGRVYFVEVKHRSRPAQGSGLEYVTRRKLRQMRFAAETWISRVAWTGEASLAALEICGADFIPGSFVESIEEF